MNAKKAVKKDLSKKTKGKNDQKKVAQSKKLMLGTFWESNGKDEYTSV